jgi:hypothetical protein
MRTNVLCGLAALGLSCAVPSDGKDTMLQTANAKIEIAFDRTTGALRIQDRRDPRAQLTAQVVGAEWSCQPHKDGLSIAAKGGELLEIELHDGYVVFNAGLVNRTDQPIQVKELRPIRGVAFAGLDVGEKFAALDGTTGCLPTKVWTNGQVECRNNLLAKFGAKPTRCLVIGGLTYHDFEKFARIDRQRDQIEFEVWSADPVGRRVEPGERYLPDDKVYVDISSQDPFAALEQYARCVRAAQGITLPTYDFPTVCLWWASQVGPKANDTLGAVREMDAAVQSGFLKYSRVGIRLLPDSYDKNNCDGWWDDEHWAKCAPTFAEPGPCYKPPYETTKKWCQAIIERGGVPISYMRTNGRSEDYATAFPGHMLFNDPNRQIRKPFAMRWWEHVFPGWTDAERNRVGYDFTDPDFLRHMRDVYANLKRAGLAGVFYDYPKITGWCHEGGFEDPHATTAKAYRNIFAVAQEGLGRDAYLQERAYFLGSDVSAGLVASQRTIWDNTMWAPPVITRAALRWYKNRVVMNYDTDGKQMLDEYARHGRDGGRTMLTMTYVASARFLLANSFSQMTPEMLYDLSRIIPFHSAPQSARPLDLFENRWPQVYDFRVDDSWHQLTFYNTAVAKGDWPSIDVDLAPFTEGRKDFPGKVKARQPVAGKVGVDLSALGLDPAARYYVYDFWNNRLVGVFRGNDRLEQELRPAEARMMSVHRVEKHPQFLSTDRHVMQGYVDFAQTPAWNAKRRALTGVSKVIGGEPYTITLAGNGQRAVRCSAGGAAARVEPAAVEGLWKLMLDAGENCDVKWSVEFD